MRSLWETVRLDACTKMLNRKWYEGMLSHGYEGVRELLYRLVNTMGWSATAGAVDNWVYEDVNTTFIQEPEIVIRVGLGDHGGDRLMGCGVDPSLAQASALQGLVVGLEARHGRWSPYP